MKRGAYVTINLAVWAALLAAPLALDAWFLTQFAQYLTYGIFAMSLALIWGPVRFALFRPGGVLRHRRLCHEPGDPGDGGRAWSPSPIPGPGFWPPCCCPPSPPPCWACFLFFGKALHGAYLGIVTLAIAVIVERPGGQLELHRRAQRALERAAHYPGAQSARAPKSGTTCRSIISPWRWPLAGLSPVGSGSCVPPTAPCCAPFATGEERTGFLRLQHRRLQALGLYLRRRRCRPRGARSSWTQFSFASPPLIGFTLSTEVLIWVALGGRGWLLAAFLGALLVKLAENWLSELLGPLWLSGPWRTFLWPVWCSFRRGSWGSLLQRAVRKGRGGDTTYRASRS